MPNWFAVPSMQTTKFLPGFECRQDGMGNLDEWIFELGVCPNSSRGSGVWLGAFERESRGIVSSSAISKCCPYRCLDILFGLCLTLRAAVSSKAVVRTRDIVCRDQTGRKTRLGGWNHTDEDPKKRE